MKTYKKIFTILTIYFFMTNSSFAQHCPTIQDMFIKISGDCAATLNANESYTAEYPNGYDDPSSGFWTVSPNIDIVGWVNYTGYSVCTIRGNSLGNGVISFFICGQNNGNVGGTRSKVVKVVANPQTLNFHIIGIPAMQINQSRIYEVIPELDVTYKWTLNNLSTNATPPTGQGLTFTVNGGSIPGTCVLICEAKNQCGDTRREYIYIRIYPVQPSTINCCLPNGNCTSGVTFDDCVSSGGNPIVSCGSCVAPIELSSFISTINQRNIGLAWSTASEENNSGFDIERSQNNEWSKIGFVQGNGTTTNPNNYSYEDRNLSSGKYKYRLKQIDYNGNFEYYELQNEVNIGTPEKFSLDQNYPNPFNPVTKINFDIPNDGFVSIKIFDNNGREVKTIVNEFKPAGYYTAEFDGSNLSSGIYFYRLESGNFVASKKMMLLK